MKPVRGLADYFKANPQVLILLVICVVLGLGTFIAVLIAVASSGNTTAPATRPGVLLAARSCSADCLALADALARPARLTA